jgi:hypothetical protein
LQLGLVRGDWFQAFDPINNYKNHVNCDFEMKAFSFILKKDTREACCSPQFSSYRALSKTPMIESKLHDSLLSLMSVQSDIVKRRNFGPTSDSLLALELLEGVEAILEVCLIEMINNNLLSPRFQIIHSHVR